MGHIMGIMVSLKLNKNYCTGADTTKRLENSIHAISSKHNNTLCGYSAAVHKVTPIADHGEWVVSCLRCIEILEFQINYTKNSKGDWS